MGWGGEEGRKEGSKEDELGKGEVRVEKLG